LSHSDIDSFSEDSSYFSHTTSSSVEPFESLQFDDNSLHQLSQEKAMQKRRRMYRRDYLRFKRHRSTAKPQRRTYGIVTVPTPNEKKIVTASVVSRNNNSAEYLATLPKDLRRKIMNRISAEKCRQALNQSIQQAERDIQLETQKSEYLRRVYEYLQQYKRSAIVAPELDITVNDSFAVDDDYHFTENENNNNDDEQSINLWTAFMDHTPRDNIDTVCDSFLVESDMFEKTHLPGVTLLNQEECQQIQHDYYDIHEFEMFGDEEEDLWLTFASNDDAC
jgi:hypothetical protein